jgi:TonB family protein
MLRAAEHLSRDSFCVLLSLIALSFLLSSPGHAQSAAHPHRKIVSQVDPEYPMLLREAHIEGLVRLELTVRPNGTVSDVRVKGGNPMLAQYACRAALRWRYGPSPTESVEEVVFSFLLNPR